MGLEYPAIGVGLCGQQSYEHERVRIGYLSGDFREHAVAYLMAGVFERHDRERFEIHALSLRPAPPSPYGRRIAQASEHFLDLSRLGDAEAAAQIRALEIDIVVDLMGYTQGGRVSILAHRPAPVQVSYLGYPATLGAPYMDYLIADEYLIPEAARDHYSTRSAYLSACF